ncbi:uncharacterized protein MONOS_3975 [Monocercomonoides exilis]|uniref:uncharacterized protein n=1 Tax=Monocercomonoides exilis TaxID=2049356 RepID=UPI003559B1D1|nr:hypothetical protein MONOS_3975 [Monocercomonoides exilis]
MMESLSFEDFPLETFVTMTEVPKKFESHYPEHAPFFEIASIANVDVIPSIFLPFKRALPPDLVSFQTQTEKLFADLSQSLTVPLSVSGIPQFLSEYPPSKSISIDTYYDIVEQMNSSAPLSADAISQYFDERRKSPTFRRRTPTPPSTPSRTGSNSSASRTPRRGSISPSSFGSSGQGRRKSPATVRISSSANSPLDALSPQQPAKPQMTTYRWEAWMSSLSPQAVQLIGTLIITEICIHTHTDRRFIRSSAALYVRLWDIQTEWIAWMEERQRKEKEKEKEKERGKEKDKLSKDFRGRVGRSGMGSNQITPNLCYGANKKSPPRAEDIVNPFANSQSAGNLTSSASPPPFNGAAIQPPYPLLPFSFASQGTTPASLPQNSVASLSPPQNISHATIQHPFSSSSSSSPSAPSRRVVRALSPSLSPKRNYPHSFSPPPGIDQRVSPSPAYPSNVLLPPELQTQQQQASSLTSVKMEQYFLLSANPAASAADVPLTPSTLTSINVPVTHTVSSSSFTTASFSPAAASVPHSSMASAATSRSGTPPLTRTVTSTSTHPPSQSSSPPPFTPFFGSSHGGTAFPPSLTTSSSFTAQTPASNTSLSPSSLSPPSLSPPSHSTSVLAKAKSPAGTGSASEANSTMQKEGPSAVALIPTAMTTSSAQQPAQYPVSAPLLTPTSSFSSSTAFPQTTLQNQPMLTTYAQPQAVLPPSAFLSMAAELQPSQKLQSSSLGTAATSVSSAGSRPELCCMPSSSSSATAAAISSISPTFAALCESLLPQHSIIFPPPFSPAVMAIAAFMLVTREDNHPRSFSDLKQALQHCGLSTSLDISAGSIVSTQHFFSGFLRLRQPFPAIIGQVEADLRRAARTLRLSEEEEEFASLFAHSLLLHPLFSRRNAPSTIAVSIQSSLKFLTTMSADLTEKEWKLRCQMDQRKQQRLQERQIRLSKMMQESPSMSSSSTLGQSSSKRGGHSHFNRQQPAAPIHSKRQNEICSASKVSEVTMRRMWKETEQILDELTVEMNQRWKEKEKEMKKRLKKEEEEEIAREAEDEEREIMKWKKEQMDSKSVFLAEDAKSSGILSIGKEEKTPAIKQEVASDSMNTKGVATLERGRNLTRRKDMLGFQPLTPEETLKPKSKQKSTK